MRYTEINGINVSGMSLGTVQLGLNYGIANNEGKPDREKSLSILKAAIDSGITAFDTARSYGDSEDVLGLFFKSNPNLKEKVFITTKLSSGLPAGSQPGDVEKTLVNSVETSLQKLELPKVNCLMLHNASDMTVHGRVVSDALRSFIKDGLADMAGVSVYHPHEIDLMLKDDVYRAVQLPLNVMDQRFLKSGALERLNDRGIYIFIRSVFFQGLMLLDPGKIDDPDLIKHAVPHIKTLRALSEKAGMSVPQFAVTFLRDLPGAVSLVLGADNVSQTVENASLFSAGSLDENLRQLTLSSFDNFDYEGVMSVLRKPKSQG